MKQGSTLKRLNPQHVLVTGERISRWWRIVKFSRMQVGACTTQLGLKLLGKKLACNGEDANFFQI
jgi:hypothetical protein